MHLVLLSIGCGVGGALGLGAGYHLFASATSDALGLKTLRHGTGPISYIGIQILGARTDFGGKMFGEAHLLDDNIDQNRFYFWNDDFNEEGCVNSNRVVRFILNSSWLHPFNKRMGPKFYASQGGASTLNIKAAPKVIRGILQTIGGLIGLFVPTISIHVTPEFLNSQTKVDPNLVPVARYTQTSISRWKYIGLSGTLCQGLNAKVFQRIKNNPMRFIKGLAKYLILTALVVGIAAQLFVLLHTTGLINVCPLLVQSGTISNIAIPVMIGSGVIFSVACYLIT